jgi:hypothetical protein
MYIWMMCVCVKKPHIWFLFVLLLISLCER